MHESTRSNYLHQVYMAASRLIDIKETNNPLYAALNVAWVDLLHHKEPSGLDKLLEDARIRAMRAREPKTLALVA